MKKKMSFEQGIAELETIVNQMETSQLPLEDSVEKYKKAMDLITHCNTILQESKLKVETIQLHTTTPKE